MLIRLLLLSSCGRDLMLVMQTAIIPQAVVISLVVANADTSGHILASFLRLT